MRVFYNDAYVAPAHDFETTRKSVWIADRLYDVTSGTVGQVLMNCESYRHWRGAGG